jgi:hypothetical protein
VWCSGWETWRPPGGLVVAVWVEGGLAQELAGGGVDDPDVQVLDQQQDVGSGVGSADADADADADANADADARTARSAKFCASQALRRGLACLVRPIRCF